MIRKADAGNRMFKNRKLAQDEHRL